MLTTNIHWAFQVFLPTELKFMSSCWSVSVSDNQKFSLPRDTSKKAYWLQNLSSAIPTMCLWRVLIEISVLWMPGEYDLKWIYHAFFPVSSQKEFICMNYKLVPLLEELSSERIRQIVVKSSVLQAQLVTVSLSLKAFSTKLKVFLPGCSLFCKLISFSKGQRKRFGNT